MMKKKRSHATVCVVLGGKTVVEVIYIYICKSYLSYFCAFSEDLCYINFSLLNSPVIPVFIIADVPDWRWARLFKTSDVVSKRFFKISNVNISNICQFSVIHFGVGHRT